MGANLGLVCITASEEVRFRTITRTRLRKAAAAEQERLLRDLYGDNLRRLAAALTFCERRGIRLYRLTSGLLPQSEDSPGREIVSEFAHILGGLGRRATKSGIRLVMHPDQYVVLSSESPSIVKNSVGILANHARQLDLLEQPRSAWAAIEIHGGKRARGEALAAEIRQLDDSIRSRLVLENDEDSYSAKEILDVCRIAGVPMVFDAHHHVVHEELDSYDHPSVAEMVALARDTWPDPAWQMVHISNGRDAFNDEKHADEIAVMPAAYRDVPWIEVEAKSKELAIARLNREWLSES